MTTLDISLPFPRRFYAEPRQSYRGLRTGLPTRIEDKGSGLRMRIENRVFFCHKGILHITVCQLIAGAAFQMLIDNIGAEAVCGATWQDNFFQNSN